MKKEVSVATISKRMNRILATHKEQQSQDDITPPEAASSSTFGQMVYTTKRGLELHKTILNFAAQNDNGSDSDLSDQSYALIESPPKRRRQPNRAVKRPAVKISAIASKRMHHRKVTCTSTSNSPSEQSEQSNSPTETMPVSSDNTESDDSDAAKTIIITTTRRKIENDNRRSTKKISSDS